MVTLTCCNCGCEFTRKSSSIPKSGRVFCSVVCNGISNRKRIISKCIVCNKLVERSISRMFRYLNKKTFCSKNCEGVWQSENQLYENAPGYKSGISVYRKLALSQYGAKCQSCGYCQDIRLIEVHHKNGDRSNNTIENLSVLCFWCHKCITRGVPIHSQHERANK